MLEKKEYKDIDTDWYRLTRSCQRFATQMKIKHTNKQKSAIKQSSPNGYG